MKVLLVQRSLSPPGGGNAVAAWMLHALAGVHELGTITSRPWSVTATNAFYGTAIPDRGITQHLIPAPWSWLSRLPDHRANRLRMCTVLREARRLADRYDLLITADNYGAFAKPGIQYLHFPAPLKPTAWRLRHVVNLYFAFCDALIGVPWSDAGRNVTLANSAWTSAGLARQYGIRSRVLHPPVLDPGEGLPWEQRDNTFLCVGRFHGSKRIENVMSIVRRVRAQVLPGARLAIVGSAVDSEYTARLHRFAARDRDWMEFHEDLPREAVNRMMGASRYGLQAMEDEHFGMATAEMARAGCLVFAHDSGGSPEVLGDPALLWKTEDDAVRRIGALVRDAVARDAVRWRVRTQARAFTTGRFSDEMRALVAAWASGELTESGLLH